MAITTTTTKTKPTFGDTTAPFWATTLPKQWTEQKSKTAILEAPSCPQTFLFPNSFSYKGSSRGQKSDVYIWCTIITHHHTPATPQGLLESLGGLMVPLGSENFKSWCPSRNAVFKHAFSSKRKLDPNNIHFFKFFSSSAFSTQKRTPFTNRWETSLAFKQFPLTCSFKGNAFARHLRCAVWAMLYRHTAR